MIHLQNIQILPRPTVNQTIMRPCPAHTKTKITRTYAALHPRSCGILPPPFLKSCCHLSIWDVFTLEINDVPVLVCLLGRHKSSKQTYLVWMGYEASPFPISCQIAKEELQLKPEI